MASARLLAIGSLAVFACGCAPMVWENQASGTPPTEAELDACRRLAHIESWHRAFVYGSTRQRIYDTRTGRLLYDPWPPFGYYDPYVLEEGAFRSCLQAKGYRLVPVDEPEDASGGEP
jgi:hypothetical protein